MVSIGIKVNKEYANTELTICVLDCKCACIS